MITKAYKDMLIAGCLLEAKDAGLYTSHDFDTDSIIVGVRFSRNAIVDHSGKVADMIRKLGELVKEGKLD